MTYFALSSGPDYAISRNVMRYLAFRLGPVFITATFASVTLARLGTGLVVPLLTLGLLHGLLTSGRALLALTRQERSARRPLLVLMHSGVVLASTGVATSAALGAQHLGGLVPSLKDVSSDLWIGLIAGVIGAYIVRILGSTHLDVSDAFRASRRSIPTHLWGAAEGLAVEANAAVRLVRAVMLVENIQRPSWFRRLERMAGRLVRGGSYGILQVRRRHPKNEIDLLKEGIQLHFRDAQIRMESGWPDDSEIARFARRYNPDSKFVELVGQAYHWLMSADREIVP